MTPANIASTIIHHSFDWQYHGIDGTGKETLSLSCIRICTVTCGDYTITTHSHIVTVPLCTVYVCTQYVYINQDQSQTSSQIVPVFPYDQAQFLSAPLSARSNFHKIFRYVCYNPWTIIPSLPIAMQFILLVVLIQRPSSCTSVNVLKYYRIIISFRLQNLLMECLGMQMK